MTEVTPAPAPAAPAATTPPVAPAAPETPPWGADFDAEKAWNLVQNLRADKDKLSQRPSLTPEQQKELSDFTAFKEASKTEAQRQQEAVEAANRGRDDATADALRLRVAIEHGLGKEDIDLLGTGTQEEVAARAKRIADLRAAAVAAPPVVPPVPGQRPIEQLRPGATPTGEVSDDQANYERLFGPGSWTPSH